MVNRALSSRLLRSLQFFLPITASILAIFQTGCGSLARGIPNDLNTQRQDSTVSVQLSADPAAIVSGSSSTLSFTSQNATAVVIDGVGTFGPSGSVQVRPTQTTTYHATATGRGGSATATTTVTVSSGTNGSFSVSPAALSFASENIGTTSAPQTVTLSNTTAGDVAINSISITGDFAQSNDCGSVVAPNSSCVVNVTFTPTAAGTRSGALTVSDSDPSSPQTVALTGTGASTNSNVVAGWLTYKFNNARTGANTAETQLSPTNVNPLQFGRKFQLTVDGLVFAQPLFARAVNVSGQGTHDLIIVATEHDSVFAFDASAAAPPLWQVSFLINGATPVPGTTQGRTALGPEVGITGTPVIDPASGTLYVSAMTMENGSAVHRLHALDVGSGAERPGSPVVITATVAGTGTGGSNGQITFDPLIQNQRAGLALGNGFVYVAFGAFSDLGTYHGWVFAFTADTLAQAGVWNSAPDGEGSSVWQAGTAPAIDSSGSVYVMTGDGHSFNANSGGRNFGDSVVKLGFAGGGFGVIDWFAPFNQSCLDNDDLDLGSGSPLLVPDLQNGLNVLVAGSKEGRIYVLNRDNMGHFQGGSNSQIVQDILVNSLACGASGFDANSSDRMYGSGAYWNGTVYQASAFSTLRAFQFQNGKLAQSSQTQVVFNASGQSGRSPIPVVSANGGSSGIVWLQQRSFDTGHEVLYAFDAANVANELWDSDMNAARDALGNGTVFSVPLVIDGKVICTTGKTINVYGLQ
jgi:hypothetical protein